MRRSERIDRIAGRRFDILVIGAGAIGAGTALAAARSGATVCVLDRGDVAGATSSASSKLLHGGLRYLAMGDLRLVREAHRERAVNARILAPHLVRPQAFLIPRRSVRLRLGVTAYGALSGFRDGHSGPVTAQEALLAFPPLRPDALEGAVRYHDHQTDDARLVLAGLRTAERHGALWLSHAEVAALRSAGGRVVGADVVDRVGGATFAVAAGVVVNAAGPWLDRVRRLEDPAAGTSVRLSKGAHLLLTVDEPLSAAVTTPLSAGRVAFALPWYGMLLLGTTDEPYGGNPDDLGVLPGDREQILAEAAVALSPDALGADRIRSAFAGLRVLPVGSSSTDRARRETVITVGAGGMVSVAGGKLTTWRAIGIEAAAQALAQIGRSLPAVPPEPLVGAADPVTVAREVAAKHPALAAPVCEHLARLYGAEAHLVLDPALRDPGLYEPIAAGGPDVTAQVRFAVEVEGAATADDVLRRRTTVAIRGLASAAVAARATAELGRA